MKTIIFDFGNVIGFFDHRRAADRLARHSDLSARDIIEAVIGCQLEDDYESGRLGTAEFLASARKLCHLRCSDEELAAAYVDIFSPNEPVCSLVPLLRQRYKLILGSNTTELHARHFKRQFADILSHFDDLVLSFEIGVRKPKVGFYEHCQRQARCAPSECLFIDDIPANIEAARAHGWNGIVFRDSDDLRRRLVELGIAF